MSAGFTQHPLSAAFPAMADADFEALCESVEKIGVINPIVIFDGMVIDGWHRYRAANIFGKECPAIELAPDADPREFVIAQNKARRNCTSSQLAFAVVKVYEWKPHGGAEYRSATVADRATESVSSAEISQKNGISSRQIERAKKVDRDASQEVKDAVNRGELSLARAVEVSKLAPEDQVNAIHAKPEPKPKVQDDHQSEITALNELVAELQQSVKDLIDDNNSMARVFESNEQVAAAMAEVKKYKEMNRILEERVRGLQNELNAAKRQAKSAMAWADKIEREAKKAEQECKAF